MTLGHFTSYCTIKRPQHSHHQVGPLSPWHKSAYLFTLSLVIAECGWTRRRGAEGIGPHTGLLKPHGLNVPSKLDESVRMHLAQRVLEELESLSTNLRIHTPRLKNLIQSNAPDRPVISLLTDHISLPASGQTLVVRLPGPCPGQPPEPPRMAGGDVVEIDLSGFPDDLRPGLHRHLAHLLRIERTHSLRQAIARGIPPTSVGLNSLIGKASSYITSDGSGLAGHRLTLTNGESERGRLGVGAMVALLRWRLYTGHGWISTR